MAVVNTHQLFSEYYISKRTCVYFSPPIPGFSSLQLAMKSSGVLSPTSEQKNPGYHRAILV